MDDVLEFCLWVSQYGLFDHISEQFEQQTKKLTAGADAMADFANRTAPNPFVRYHWLKDMFHVESIDVEIKAEAMTLPEYRKEKTDIELSEEKLLSERDALKMKLNVQHDVGAKIDLFKETCYKFLSKINDPKIMTERLKKDIIKLVIDEVVIDGEHVKIFATIPLPTKIHERELVKTDLPGTFNSGATLCPVNETNMARIWNKHRINTPLKKKVFVGMSGGVDSSVSAALLIEAGFDVIGVFMKVWSPEWLPCSWREERRDAMRVAAHLKIPLLTFDFEKEYKKEVADYMIAEYAAGRVPNPDVACNKFVKFDAFLKKAVAMGADYIATGHYARVRQGKLNLASRMPSELGILEAKFKPVQMLAGVDNEKDQTYFLWTLNQERLGKILFPVGGLQKSEVRKLARKFGLPVAEKKDSQGICFLGKVDLRDFLKHYIKEKRGDVLDEAGTVIGHHEGAMFYTLGQRHGFIVAQKGEGSQPFFVVGKDVKKNTITVSAEKKTGEHTTREVSIADVNWIAGELPKTNKKYTARIRYRQELQKCKLKCGADGTARVVFDKSQEAVAAGQSLVVYDGKVCLGGGVIQGDES